MTTAAVQLSLWPAASDPQADYVAEMRRVLRYSGYRSLRDCYERTTPQLRLPDGTLVRKSFAECFPGGDVSL